MSVAKVTEVISTSTISYDDAISDGIARASKTLRNIKGAWVTDHSVEVDDGKIIVHKVRLKVTFVLDN